MEKIGVLGGSFDPPHLGHVRLAKKAIEILELDNLLVIPANVSPLKTNKTFTSPKNRYNMCKLAFGQLKKVEVSDIEIKRGGTSFTIDTLEKIRSRYPLALVYLIIGSDAFLRIRNWKTYPKILSQVVLCPALRSREELPLIEKHTLDLKQKHSAKITFLDFSPLSCSSTQIRENLSSKEGNALLNKILNEKVIQYIIKGNLY